jgi:uncharacterized protein (TIGR02594 family)
MKKVLDFALSQYGVKEIKGEKHNEKIVKYFNEIGHNWVRDDETAWCSAFMNWCCMSVGVTRSGKLNARSWLNVGNGVGSPIMGDGVVFWRDKKDSWKGHIGLYVNDLDDKYINILGGNQNNMVCIKPYPKERVLSYRRLSLKE